MSLANEVADRGFGIVADVVDPELHGELARLFDEGGRSPGKRIGLGSAAVRLTVESPRVGAIATAILGPGAFAVKATLFDKQTSCNWIVPWHQDLMISVRERREAAGYDAWSDKDGITYVRPPVEVLQQMVAIRLDLDGSTPATGSLRALAGTHVRGALDETAIAHAKQELDPVDCVVPRFGAMVMRPLLLHASGKAPAPEHRRIVHLEFANCELGGGLEWHERVTVATTA